MGKNRLGSFLAHSINQSTKSSHMSKGYDTVQPIKYRQMLKYLRECAVICTGSIPVHLDLLNQAVGRSFT